MGEETRKSLIQETVRLFSHLYSVVIALSLTTAVRSVVSPVEGVRSPLSIPTFDLIMFGTFIIILIPFYHGDLLFLARNYREGFRTKKRGELLIDFAFLLSISIMFLAMAQTLIDISIFIGWLSFLMIVDVIWVVFTHYKSTTEKSSAPLSWACLNSIYIFILYLLNHYLIAEGEVCAVCLLAASGVRSILDYSLNYRYYFPSEIKPQNVRSEER